MSATRLPIAPRSGDGDDASGGSPAGSRDPAPTSSWARLGRWIPALGSLQGYGFASLNADVVAGITVAAVALPQAMAYATVIGLPPQYGLYTAIVVTAVGALFDSSRQLINGPTNAISIAVLSALLSIPVDARLSGAVLLALMVGVIQTGITLLRLGDLTRFISHAVIVGFTAGAAGLLILEQLPAALGLEPAAAGGHVLARFVQAIAGVGGVNLLGLGLGLGTAVVVAALRRVNAALRQRTGVGLPVLPEMLTAMVLAAGTVYAFDLEAAGVAVVGAVPAELPSFAVPEVEWQRVRELAGDAMAIALLGLLEAIAMAKAIAAKTGQRLDMNQQCLSEGLANIAGSFFRCFPGSGSLTRSMINREAGAVSQWSGVFAAAAVAGTVLLLAPYAAYIPRASLAAILVIIAARMIDRRELRYYLRTTRFDAGVVAATALSAVVISIEFCILIGIFLSFVLYVPRAARLHLTELVLTSDRTIRPRNDGDALCTKMLLFNLEGELFFGAAPELEELLAGIEARVDESGVRAVILRCREVRNPDAGCIVLVDDFIARLLARRVHILLCGVRPALFHALERTGSAARLGEESLLRERPKAWTGIHDAVARAQARLGDALCPTCPLRLQEPEARDRWYYMI
ncbi:MAG: SulP family inorganic anion transporter [Nannocystaceae bacterium]